MKHNKKLAMLLVGTQLLMALTSCSTNNNNSTNNNANGASSTAGVQSEAVTVEAKTEFDLKNMTDVVLETAGLTADTVIATAGGRDLTAGAVLALTVSELDYLYQMSMYGMGDIPWGQEIDGELYETTALRSSAEMALIYQIIFEVAEEEGLTVDEGFHTELRAYLDGLLVEIGGNETIYQYVLWQALTTEEDFIRNSEANELFNVIYDKYFGEGGTKVPSDDEIMDIMVEQEYYQVKHILLSTVDQTTNEPLAEEEKAAVLAKAEEILADLQASDDLENYFHEQMLELSEDPGSIAMPDGYTAYPGQMVPEFEAASYELAEYEMSGLVESDFGYHIIYRLPLKADLSAISEYINELAIEMQEGWISENPIETNELFEQIDLKVFYDNLNVLRGQLQPYVEAGDPDLVMEETTEDETVADETVEDADSEAEVEETPEESPEEEESEEESDEESEEESDEESEEESDEEESDSE